MMKNLELKMHFLAFLYSTRVGSGADEHRMFEKAAGRAIIKLSLLQFKIINPFTPPEVLPETAK